MTIERTDSEIIFRVPSDLSSFGLDNIISYLKYLESTKNSKALEKKVDEIANESKSRWWAENKNRFIK
jgi:hypothetical protein